MEKKMRRTHDMRLIYWIVAFVAGYVVGIALEGA